MSNNQSTQIQENLYEEIEHGNLAKLRNRAGLSQNQLAKLTGVSVWTLRNWEQENKPKKFEQLSNINKVVNTLMEHMEY